MKAVAEDKKNRRKENVCVFFFSWSLLSVREKKNTPELCLLGVSKPVGATPSPCFALTLARAPARQKEGKTTLERAGSVLRQERGRESMSRLA